MYKEIHFGSIIIPAQSFTKDEQHVAVGVAGEQSVATMRRYLIPDGRIALSVQAGTTGVNRTYIKDILPDRMTLEEIIDAVKVHFEIEGTPFDPKIIDILTMRSKVPFDKKIEI